MSTETKERTAAPESLGMRAETTGNVPAVARPRLEAGAKVGAIIPTDLDQVYRLAQWIAAAGWAPKSYREDVPENAPKGTLGKFSVERISIGIMQGLEVGFSPIAALQSIAVINGTPSIWGDGALALILSSGLVEDHVEKALMEEREVQTEVAPGQPGPKIKVQVCVGYTCMFKRKGKLTPVEQRFDEAEAQKAHLLEKRGPWQEYRRRMYQMRARAWAMRDTFADVLRGLAIREEVEDMIDVTNSAAPQPQAQPKTAKAALDAFANKPTSTMPEAPPPAAASKPRDDEGNGNGESPPPPPVSPLPPPPPAVSVPDAPARSTGLALDTPQPKTIDESGLPVMPKDAQEQFAADRKSWMGAWRWLQMQLLEIRDPETAQKVAERHVDVLRVVAAHNATYKRTVKATLEKAQVQVDLEG